MSIASYCLQRPVLNKRLGVVILEGVVKTLFKNSQFEAIFQKLHSRSSKVKSDNRRLVDIRCGNPVK